MYFFNRTRSSLKIYKDFSVPRVAGTFAPAVRSFRFRLSGAPGNDCWKVFHTSTPGHDLKAEEEELMWLSYCDHKAVQFGLCYHQAAEFLQNYYSSGKKFLTAFPDGSAQVFYPSGLLALVVVLTEQNGRVCIVYDDNSVRCQRIRAVFQSDGRAACYHSNDSIWLVLNGSGGQCLTAAGARTCQWSWGGGSSTPTPLHPFFLSLNKTVGVRILGNKTVFVSFVASGQQAKFSVGSCCSQGECKASSSRSSASKEEVFLLASKIRINLAIQQLHHFLTAPSRSRAPKMKLAPHLRAAAQKLLEDGADEETSDRDTAFIHRCLQEF
ncbi:glutamate-rich protein 6 isoform X3 [Kryptolebias marmoratus]|uniref:glutamate-rich protein 6 isoform X3 n=1 Tax=Kryptolebias marmoratus TaxID=37003 RepID=UPI0018ACAFCF|nr:glutamate-rich protein 6 isoform X3 [Kryptolebias marmoratus]